MKKESSRLMDQIINLDTQTTYFANGDVNIYPCMYEQDKMPVTSQGSISHRGRLVLDEDGTGRFCAYKMGTGCRYISLYHTESGLLYKSPKKMIVKLSLPVDMDAARSIEALYKQIGDICNFIKNNL